MRCALILLAMPSVVLGDEVVQCAGASVPIGPGWRRRNARPTDPPGALAIEPTGESTVGSIAFIPRDVIQPENAEEARHWNQLAATRITSGSDKTVVTVKLGRTSLQACRTVFTDVSFCVFEVPYCTDGVANRLRVLIKNGVLDAWPASVDAFLANVTWPAFDTAAPNPAEPMPVSAPRSPVPIEAAGAKVTMLPGWQQGPLGETAPPGSLAIVHMQTRTTVGFFPGFARQPANPEEAAHWNESVASRWASGKQGTVITVKIGDQSVKACRFADDQATVFIFGYIAQGAANIVQVTTQGTMETWPPAVQEFLSAANWPRLDDPSPVIAAQSQPAAAVTSGPSAGMASDSAKPPPGATPSGEAPTPLQAATAEGSPLAAAALEAMTGERPGGEVLATKALMRSMIGPMKPDEEKAFNKKWATAYTSSPKARARCRAMNPILLDVLLERDRMMWAAKAIDAAAEDAAIAEALDDRDGVEEATQIATLEREALKHSSDKLDRLAKQLEEIQKAQGDPLADDEASREQSETAAILAQLPAGPAADSNLRPIGQFVLRKTVTGSLRDQDPQTIIQLDTNSLTVEDKPATWKRGLQKFKYMWAPPPPVIDTYYNMQHRHPSGQQGSIEFTVVRMTFTIEDIGSTPGSIKPDTSMCLFAYPAYSASIEQFIELNRLETDACSDPAYGAPPGQPSCITLEPFDPETLARKTARASKEAEAGFELQGLIGIGRDGDRVWVEPEPSSQALFLDIKVACRMQNIHYIYDWRAADQEPKPDSPATASDVSLPDGDNQAAVIAESIREHEAYITSARKMIGGYKDDMAKESDSQRSEQIRLKILHGEQDVHDLQDTIASLRSGLTVHTRGPWEEHAAAVAVRTSEQTARECRDAHELRAAGVRILRVLNQYDPAKAREGEKVLFEQAGATLLDKGGLERAQAAINQLHDAATTAVKLDRDQQLGEHAEQMARAARADRNLYIAETVKKTCDRTIMAVSVVATGGSSLAISVAYEAASSSIEEGPAQAAKKAAMQGGMLLGAYGTFKAGSYLWGKFMNPRAAEMAKKELGEAFQAAKFKQELEWNQALVNQVKGAEQALAKAEAAGGQGYLALRQKLDDAISAANSSTLAKRIMKNEAFAAEEALTAAAKQAAAAKATGTGVAAAQEAERLAVAKLQEVQRYQQTYIKRLDRIYEKVDDEFIKQIQSQGYNVEKSWLKEFRNATSKGVNADRDFGLLRQFETQITKNGRPVFGLEGFRAEAQAIYNKAYSKFNAGRSATLADQSLTNSAFSEAFPLEWLDKATVKMADAASCAKAGQTIYNKVANAMASKDPVVVNLQKACASLAKDLKTKVLVKLEAGASKLTPQQLQGAREHWTEVMHAMDDFSKGKTDPIRAMQELRRLTGGRSITETAASVNKLMSKL